MTPTEGQGGTLVTITGSCFGTDGQVFNSGDLNHLQTSSWSDTEIKIGILALDSGVLQVTVTTLAGQSNAVEFLLYNYFLRDESDVCVRGEITIRVTAETDASLLIAAHGDTLLRRSFESAPDDRSKRWWNVGVPEGSEIAKTLEYAADPSVEWADVIVCYRIDDPTIAPTASPAPSPATLPNTGGRP